MGSGPYRSPMPGVYRHPTSDGAEIPSNMGELVIQAESRIQCGEEARAQFLFDEEYTNLNHGSFGATPIPVRIAHRRYQDASEARPDKFIRYEFPELLLKSRAAVAEHINCSRSDVVLVANATTGLNVILRNLVYQPGDVCVYFSTMYAAIEKTLLYLVETTPLETTRIPLTYPLDDAGILSLFKQEVSQIRSQGKNPRMAVFDTISSMPGVRFPFEHMTELCREEGILSVIDGAQGIGQIPIDLATLNPDYFVSNLHKWLSVPRGCAVVYAARRNQVYMRSSLPTSHGFVPIGVELNNPLPKSSANLSPFEVNFEMTGTVDNTSFCCVPEAIAWRKRLVWENLTGEDAIIAYSEDQAKRAASLLAEILGTDIMGNGQETFQRCSFSMVRLPLKYEELRFGDSSNAAVDIKKVIEVARWVEKILVDEYHTFVAIIFHAGSFWVRVSAQIYLTLEDWRNAGTWLGDACKRAREHDW